MRAHIRNARTTFLQRNTVPSLFLRVTMDTILAAVTQMPQRSWVYLFCWLSKLNTFHLISSWFKLGFGSWQYSHYSILLSYVTERLQHFECGGHWRSVTSLRTSGAWSRSILAETPSCLSVAVWLPPQCRDNCAPRHWWVFLGAHLLHKSRRDRQPA